MQSVVIQFIGGNSLVVLGVFQEMRVTLRLCVVLTCR